MNELPPEDQAARFREGFMTRVSVTLRKAGHNHVFAWLPWHLLGELGKLDWRARLAMTLLDEALRLVPSSGDKTAKGKRVKVTVRNGKAVTGPGKVG